MLRYCHLKFKIGLFIDNIKIQILTSRFHSLHLQMSILKSSLHEYESKKYFIVKLFIQFKTKMYAKTFLFFYSYYM